MEKASMPNAIECFGYVKCNRAGFIPLIKDIADVLCQKCKEISRRTLVSKTELDIAYELESLKMLPNLLIQNTFEDLTDYGQEANWTVVCCIGQISFLWNRNYNSLFPASWKSTCSNAESEELREG